MVKDIARASVTIAAAPDEVWAALTDPATISQYYFGTTVTTDWQPGSEITWAGEYEGTPYEDRGVIVDVDAPRLLRHTHFSPSSGKPDLPENHHTLTYTLTEVGGGTEVALEQDNNDTPEAAKHSADNWQSVLNGLKEILQK